MPTKIADLRNYTVDKLKQVEKIDNRTIKFVNHEKISNVIECKTKEKEIIRILPQISHIKMFTNLDVKTKKAVQLAELNGERFFVGVGYAGIDRIISCLKKTTRAKIKVQEN